MAGPEDFVFRDALEDLRIAGSIVLHEAYEAPWAIDVPDGAELARLMKAGKGICVTPFHLLRRGGFDLHHEGTDDNHLSAPEVIICPSGKSHRIGDGKSRKVHALAEILLGTGPKPAHSPQSGTELVCGVFQLRSAPLNPLLSALPPVLKLNTGDRETHPKLARIAELMTLELEAGTRDSFTLARLLELFCAEAIRAYQANEGMASPGWFLAIGDGKVGEAIRQVHQNPGHAWTVSELADRASMSPSRFAARFRETTGMSAMAYVARWRMSVACRLLRDTDLSLAQIAANTGYEDLAAFSRAFKSLVGDAPAHWRSINR